MFTTGDTIVAVATPPTALRSIIRISGPRAVSLCQELCNHGDTTWIRGIVSTTLAVSSDLCVDVILYVFREPRSYTGEDLVEIHVTAGAVVIQALLQRLLQEQQVRQAAPGEFTARAYSHGKLDLSQAEAVYEIIHCTNQLQMDAAQGLLRGRLETVLSGARSALLESLSLLEAELDFSHEDVDTPNKDQAIERATAIEAQLQTVLTYGLHDRDTIHLPSVGIAGVTNTGKSTLFNALLGQARSIISDTQGTTRDVLAGRLSLPHGECLLFDCAGLLVEPDSLLDRLAQEVALTSLQQAHHILYCVDLSRIDWSIDQGLYQHLPTQTLTLLGTKSDVAGSDSPKRQAALESQFSLSCLPVSALTGQNLDVLIRRLDKLLSGRSAARTEATDDLLVLCARHHQALQAACENLHQANEALKDDLTEVAALLLRSAYQHLDETTQHLDEEILGQIFSRFCIGK